MRKEQLVVGRNGTAYYMFIPTELISRAINDGDAFINKDGLPQSRKILWEKLQFK